MSPPWFPSRKARSHLKGSLTILAKTTSGGLFRTLLNQGCGLSIA